MPFGFPDPVDVGAAIATGVQTITGSVTDTVAAVADELSNQFDDVLDATADEWQEFLDGLDTEQFDVMTVVAAFVADAHVFLTSTPQTSTDMFDSTAAATQAAESLLHGWSLVSFGADLALRMLDAFDGDAGVADAIRANCPLVANTIGA